MPGEPILVNDLLYWFAFDSMGEFAFNQDFGMMQHQEWHFAIKLFGRALSIIGPFAPVVWLIKIGFAFLPWFGKIKDWFSMLSFCRQRMEDRMKVSRTSVSYQETSNGVIAHCRTAMSRHDHRREMCPRSLSRQPRRMDMPIISKNG